MVRTPASGYAGPVFSSGSFVRPIRSVALLSALLAVSIAHAGAPAAPFLPDPFLRSAPAAQPTTLVSTPTTAPALPNTPAGQATVAGRATVPTFGAPRFFSSGGTTRAVFDLPGGLRYTLTPTFSGLRLDVRLEGTVGGQVAPATILQARHVVSPGAAISDYTLTPDPVGGGQLLLQTPFPLGGAQGWNASETTIASGGRVLIVNLGAALGGGADSSVSGAVQTVAGPPAPADPAGRMATGTAQATVTQAALSQAALSQAALSQAATAQAAPPQATRPQAEQLPPGDSAAPLGASALPTSTPALAGSTDITRVTAGVVGGPPGGAAPLAAPRIGQNPGLTRVVLDLPPGAGFRITPLPLGLRIDLSGVAPAQLASQPNLTPELRAWSFAPNLTGTSVTLLTASPMTLRSGWRDVLLPPATGSQLSRLAIDVSPALADTSPLGALALAPLRSSRGPILAFSGAPNRPKVVLDPGHGGSDPGSIGQVVEKQVTLEVAQRVRAELQSAGIDVIMTRNADTALSADKNTDLGLRAALGTGVAQLFVSIHVNSTEAASALNGYGIETWWNANHPNSQALAQSIQQDTVASTAAYSRGLKNQHTLAVLRQSRIPAALVEIGYTSHPVDGLNLKDNNYLDRVAFGVASGIRDALQAGLGATWR